MELETCRNFYISDMTISSSSWIFFKFYLFIYFSILFPCIHCSYAMAGSARVSLLYPLLVANTRMFLNSKQGTNFIIFGITNNSLKEATLYCIIVIRVSFCYCYDSRISVQLLSLFNSKMIMDYIT